MTQKESYCMEHGERLATVESKVEVVENEITKLDSISESIQSLRHDVKWIKYAIMVLAAAAAADNPAILQKLAGVGAAAAAEFMSTATAFAMWIR